MPLSAEEIQRPRSPRELFDFVESVRERAKTDDKLREAGHLRRGYLKAFFDEIVPLATFVIATYPETFKVQPVLGNQGYDAEIFDSAGTLFERVEIANPIDGDDVAQTGRDLADRSYGGIKVEDPGDDLERMIPIIARTAQKKSAKDYSDAIVVFNVGGQPALPGFEKRLVEQIGRIRETLRALEFKAKRVHIILPGGAVERVDDAR